MRVVSDPDLAIGLQATCLRAGCGVALVADAASKPGKEIRVTLHCPACSDEYLIYSTMVCTSKIEQIIKHQDEYHQEVAQRELGQTKLYAS